MVTPIPKPGIEVVQEIRNPTPNFVRPTLPALISAPAYEVIELFANGSLNDAQAKYTDEDGGSYDNFKPLNIAQTDFPGGHITGPTNGRTNVAVGMVDILEEEVRAFVQYGPVRELAEHDTSDNTRVMKGFLVAHNIASRPYVRGKTDISAGGLALNGFTLSLIVDQIGGAYPDFVPSRTEGSDIVVTFSQGTEVGGTLSAQDVVDQINSAIPNIAHLVTVGSAQYLAIVSPSYGANARVLVRDTGASTNLGFHSLGSGDLYSLGAGFRAKDDGDGDLESPIIELYRGSARKSALAADADIQVGALSVKSGLINFGLATSYDSTAHPIDDIDFSSDSQSALLAGDEMYADGVRLGYLFSAQKNQLVLGGGAVAASQSEIRKKEVNLQTHSSSPFAPRNVYFYARNLSADVDPASDAATVDSASFWLDPEQALVEGANPATVAFGAGVTFIYTATVDGVLSTQRTHVLSGSGSVAELKSAFNTGTGGSILCDPPLSTYGELEAVDHSTDAATHVALRTVETGEDQKFTVGQGTANILLDPATPDTPNISDNLTYVGLPYHTTGAKKGDDANAWVKDGAVRSSVDAVTNLVAVKNITITSIENNKRAAAYKLDLEGNFGSVGPYSEATLDGLYGLSRALNGLTQPSSGSVVINTVDGDNTRAGEALQASDIKWHFQGPDEYVRFTGTVSGSFSAGELVIQATSGALGIVIASSATELELAVVEGSALFDVTNTITGAVSGATLPSPVASPRLAVTCHQVGRSNKVTLNDGDDPLSDSIGFVDGDDVRGVGVRPGASLFLQLDQNPVFVATTPLEKNLRWGTRDGIDVISMEDIRDDLNDNVDQNVVVIYDVAPGTDSAVFRLTSIKVGLPSELKIDPLGPDETGNPGYVEIWNSSTTLSTTELGLSFSESLATDQPSTDVGRGVLVKGSGRPLPDFAVTSSQPAQVFVGSQVLRDPSTGRPLGNAKGVLYLTYRGLRQDITALQKSSGFAEPLEYSERESLLSEIGPLNDKNPLGLALDLALQNATNISVKAVGVDEVSADNLYGTLSAWSRLYEFLEPHRVYAISSICGKDTRIHDLMEKHIRKMSDGGSIGERIGFISSEVPSRKVPSLVGAGLDANSGNSLNSLQLESSIASSLQSLGVSDISNITYEDDIYIEIEGESRRWQLVSATPSGVGTLIVLRTSYLSGQNSDLYYSTDSLPTGLVNVDWAVYQRGELITSSDAIAEAMAAQSQRYSYRRMNNVRASKMAVNLTGTEEEISSEYLTSIYATLSSQLSPQQGLTNYEIRGVTKVFGTNDSFSDAQMNVIAGGGNNIIIQPIPGGPVFSRHQLTTDVSIIETQEASVTRILDYTSYFMRDGVRNFIGTFNITPAFVDQLSTGIQGMLSLLEERGVIISSSLNNISIDENNPTQILVDITLELPLPVNNIRITLAI
jgi:hypothetical protein